MRIRGLSILLTCLALAACQGAGPVSQGGAPRAHASVAGSHVDVDDDRVSTFRVTSIDGWPVNRAAEQDPSKTLGVDIVNDIDAGRPVRVAFEGLTRYRNTVRSVFWSPHGVEGNVEFVPVADTRYVVRGEIGAEGSVVWLENAATHEIVTRKFAVAPGAASAPDVRTPASGL